MARQIDISQAYLKSVLSYNPESGLFIWKQRDDASKRVNSKYAGKIAGSVNDSGYIMISINRAKELHGEFARLF